MLVTPKWRFSKMDSIESAFFSRQLEQIRAELYNVLYPELLARTFIPVDHSVSPGAETVTWRAYDKVGLAKVVRDYAKDFPRADIKGTENTSFIRSLGDSFGYSIQEMRAAMYANVALSAGKADAARRAMEELLDAIARNGDSVNRLLGLFNQVNTTVFTVPNGALGSALWVNKSPDEIAKDMHGIANNIVALTKQIHIPDTLLLPLTQYTLVATVRMGDGTDTTVLDFFLKTNPYIKVVKPWYNLTGAGAASTDRMICYKNDPKFLQLIIPQEFEMFPPEQEGMEIVNTCHMRTGGVIVYYPLSISYGDGI